jgi:hypothetical protein
LRVSATAALSTVCTAMGLPRSARAAAAIAAGAALTGCLWGCGGSAPTAGGLQSRTPAQIVRAAEVAVKGAVSAHVAGSIVSAGKPISLDMELVAGKGGKGEFALDGLRVDLIEVGSEAYVRGDEAFDAEVLGSAIARRMRGKWLKVPADGGPFGALFALGDLDRFVGEALASHGSLAAAAGAEIDGRQTVAVRDRSGAGTLYVEATGTPYPLEIAERGGRLTFDRWNGPVTLTPPSEWVNVNMFKTGR